MKCETKKLLSRTVESKYEESRESDGEGILPSDFEGYNEAGTKEEDLHGFLDYILILSILWNFIENKSRLFFLNVQ